MIIAVIGSRDFNNYDLLKTVLSEFSIDSIVSGGAKGADTLAEQYAEEFNIDTHIIKPNWKLGRGAGIIRNKEIITACDYCIAFWDGKSKGTKSSIDFAKKTNKGLKIVRF